MAKKKRFSLGRLLLAGPTFGLSLYKGGTLGGVGKKIFGGIGGKGGDGGGEPDYVTQARQQLINLESPQGFADALTKNIQALQGQYAPLFQQQANELLNNVQQRIIAGQPSGLIGVSGPEVLGLRNAATQQLLPQEQATLTNAAMDNIRTQMSAANQVIGSEPPLAPDLMSTMLGTFGGSAAGGLGGGLVSLLLQHLGLRQTPAWPSLPNATASSAAQAGGGQVPMGLAGLAPFLLQSGLGGF